MTQRRIFKDKNGLQIIAFAQTWYAATSKHDEGTLVSVSKAGYGMLLKVELGEIWPEYWRLVGLDTVSDDLDHREFGFHVEGVRAVSPCVLFVRKGA